MSTDISGTDRIDVVGESFYRSALQRVVGDGEPVRNRVASLVPDPSNPYDSNAVKVVIDNEHIGHLPREVAAAVADAVADLAQNGPVTCAAEIRGFGTELGFGVALDLDLEKLNAVLVDEVGDEIGSPEESPAGHRVADGEVIRPCAQDPGPAPKPISPERARGRIPTIERAVEKWKTELIDLSARNRLLFMRDLRSGTLSFDSSAREPLMQLVAGKRVALSKIVQRSKLPESPAAKLTPFEDAVRRMRTIVRTARSYEEERGVRTLFLACGVATWRHDRASRPPAAPVLLVPLEIRPRGASQQDFELSLAGDLEVNPTLLHMLKVEFNLEIDDRELYEHSEMDGVIDTPEELRLAFNWLSDRCAGVPDWVIIDRFVLGNFWYAKLPMVKDLERSVGALAAHDVAAAFAGDAEARSAVIARRGTAGQEMVKDVDELLPAEEFNVLDSDSSQSLAIARARAGENLVLKGPPGTGKSQTIANLICGAIGEGKRVLFVAEKRAAIDAVTKRLNGAGLSDLVLDLHQGAESRKWLAAQLGTSLARARAAGVVPRDTADDRLVRARESLREHTDALHRKNPPWNVSIFDAQLEVLGRGRPKVTTRLRGSDLEAVTASRLAELAESLRDLVAIEGLTLKARSSPWADAKVETSGVAREAEEVLVRLTSVPSEAEAKAVAAARATGLREPLDIAQGEDLLSVWQAARDCSEVFDLALLGSDLDPPVEALQPLQGSALTRLIASIGSGDYRSARGFVREHLKGEREFSSGDLYAHLVACLELQHRWRDLRISDSGPAVPDGLDAVAADLGELRRLTEQLGAIVGRDLAALPFAELETELARLHKDSGTVRLLPSIHAARQEFDSDGMSGFLAELEANADLLDDAGAELDRLWWQSVADHLLLLPDVDTVASFRGGRHDQVSGGFRELDRDHITATAQRVSRLAAEAAVGAQDRFPDQAQLVHAQAQRKRGHMPVRELFAAAPDVVTALRPCWVMSPLMVSQLIPSERAYFDIVVFDEASQVRPVDALTSMIRGEQLVVAGDQHQLPPTAFFDATATSDESKAQDEEESTEIADYESLLDVLITLFETEMLRWHYRSHDERLIGFSNQEIYDNGLTTFPGVINGDVLEHVWVDALPAEGELRVSPDAEVKRVVDLVIQHARSRPEESLGVIALGIQHADAIEAGLLAEMPNHPDLESFFDEDREERFFVKNLERVQGDERDAVILAVGYGKLPDGTLPHRFGPLNQAGGERRLNVAVSRAKRRMTVVSSFQAEDIDPSRSSARGVQLLRAFLAYAAAGGDVEGSASESIEPNALQRKIAAALRLADYECVELLGFSADRVDVAVADPTTGLPLVAIETDGATYARRPSVRDRDRLRSEHLERLGWQYISTWSQDWYRDSSAAARDLLQQVGERLERAHSIDASDLAEDQGGDDEGGTEERVEVSDRGPRPSLPTGGLAITDWQVRDLVELARWIESDGLLRTGDELRRDLMEEIGITRRGSRVVRVLDEVILAVRGRSS